MWMSILLLFFFVVCALLFSNFCIFTLCDITFLNNAPASSQICATPPPSPLLSSPKCVTSFMDDSLGMIWIQVKTTVMTRAFYILARRFTGELMEKCSFASYKSDPTTNQLIVNILLIVGGP